MRLSPDFQVVLADPQDESIYVSCVRSELTAKLGTSSRRSFILSLERLLSLARDSFCPDAGAEPSDLQIDFEGSPDVTELFGEARILSRTPDDVVIEGMLYDPGGRLHVKGWARYERLANART